MGTRLVFQVMNELRVWGYNFKTSKSKKLLWPQTGRAEEEARDDNPGAGVTSRSLESWGPV